VKTQSALDIPADHPVFAGHFPGFPVLPGAVLVDEALSAIEVARGIDLRCWHIGSAKFHDTVRPGDSLVLDHEAPEPGLIRFTLRAGNRRVASGTLHEC
jgi:3-hydroxymyristoyl/3-hydroxydecanoyl-(acyl carrier protein) dehydratase